MKPKIMIAAGGGGKGTLATVMTEPGALVLLPIVLAACIARRPAVC